MLGYSEEALAKAKEYLKGPNPNEVYLYRGKMIVFHTLGGEYTYTDNIAAFDSRTGEELGIDIRTMSDFWEVAEKLS